MQSQIDTTPSSSTSSSNTNPSSATSSFPYSDTNTNSSSSTGMKIWVPALVFSLFILLLPAILRGGVGSGSHRHSVGPTIAVKNGWDLLTLSLVVFAILCGLLARGGNDDNGSSDATDKSPSKLTASKSNEWDENPNAMRRMRSSSSYPDLRLDAAATWGAATTDAWRFYDDAELYRSRRPTERSWDPDPHQFDKPDKKAEEVEAEPKTIPVDTYVLKKPASEVKRKRIRRRSFENIPKMAETEAEEKRVRSSRWSGEKLPKMVEIVEEEQLIREEEKKPVASPPTPPPPPPLERRRQRSAEKLPKMMVQEEKAYLPVTPPPPPPPPPPMGTEERRSRKRSGSGGGAKDLASALALFYQKKRGGGASKSKKKQDQHDVSTNPNLYINPNAAAAPPPPPPPPPSSIFYQLFSNKKIGSRSRRIHSDSPAPAPAPPPPPLPPITHKATASPPAPSARKIKKHTSPLSMPQPQQPPPRAPSPPLHYKRREKSDLSYRYPLPPPSPLPPSPPPPPFFEEEMTNNVASPVSCPSPDVDAKADKFIARFRAGLKLEKVNSYKEKQRRRQDEQRRRMEEQGGNMEEEFMAVGSLFDDDDLVSTALSPTGIAVGGL